MNTLKFGNGEWYGKKDTILAYNDLNSNFKPLPFSFDRASSATVVNKAGLIETVGSGEPRIDYKDDSKGALKLEPSRTNYVLYSETEGIIRGSNGWSGDSDSTITQNYGTTPFNGSELKSTRIQFTSFSREFRNNISSVTIIPTCSIWIKGLVGKTIKFGSDGNEGVFTLNGEWQKLVQTGSSLSTSRLTINTYSSTTARDIEIFAPQLEQGNYATSIIPTSGGAVTRVQDSCSQTVPSGAIGQTEGTVFLDFKPQTLEGTSRYLSIENSSSVGSGWLGVFASLVSGNIRFRFYGDGWDINSSVIIEKGTRYKIAFSYKDGVQTSIYVNGNLINNITASLSGKSYQKIRLSEAHIGVKGDADFNDIKLYDTIKTNAELQALTTL